MVTACAQCMGGSCDICRTAHRVALATKNDVDSLLQWVLDLEVCLKTENKFLHLQVLALEERNDHLESEIAMLRSNTCTKAKASSTNNKPHQKNSLPLPDKSLLHSSIPPPTQIGNPTSNPQATEPAVIKPTSPPKAFCIVWGTQWHCTSEVLLRDISLKEDSKNGVVKSPIDTRTGRL